MRKVLWAFLLVSFQIVAFPRVSLAHAAVISSDPEAGAELGSAPGVVVILFSEPINAKLSRARVLAPDGTPFEGSVSASLRIDVPLTTNARGIYELEWTTVSAVDGHTLHGSFQFGVGVRPERAQGIVEDEPGLPELAVGVGRAIEDVALFLASGALLLNFLSRRRPTLEWVRPRPTASLVVATVAGLAVVIGEALLAAPSLSWGSIWTYLTSEATGIVRLLRPMIEAASVAASLVSVGSVVPFVALAFALLAASGHAAAVEPAALGAGIETVHLWSAACWAGGILALSRLHPDGGLLQGDGRPLVERFTPIALVTFGVTAATGILRAVQELGGLGPLFTSLYGWTLLAKVLAIGLMVELSFLAWRRIAIWPRAEASLAIIAIGAAALLASFPLPPSRTEATRGQRAEQQGLAGLPSATALTLGGHAGSVLVGLTIAPAEPGVNEITLFLLPLQGESAAAGISAKVDIEGARVPLTQCRATCRKGVAALEGGERIEVFIPGDQGGTASFELPHLPPPPADDLVGRMMLRMHALRTYRLDETLSSGGPSVTSRYAFQAPDRAESTTETSEGTSHVVWIGSTQYLHTPGNAWSVSKGGPPQKVPSFIWDYFRPFRDVHEIGQEDADGVRTSILAFFGGNDTTPVWFRLWIDGEGLVRRAEMRAQGHFMDHRYFAFNVPVRIQRPEGAQG